MTSRTWGLMGMGVMGTNLARNFAKKGIPLALYNRYVQGSEEQIALKRTQTYPELKEALAFESLSQFINTLEQPRKILIMLPAGSVIDGILNELSPLLSRGDVIIDGGNSHYEDTEKRALLMAQKKILFLGMGVSGGAEGALHGPSLMVGGDKEGYQLVAKDLENIAAKNRQGNPCCGYLGKGGAGHFVKMVHNGIEYGEMQLLAEIFELNLSSSKSNLETQQKQFSDWNNTESKSYLLEITAEILSYKEKGAPFIDLILDQASNKGTGAWATSSGAATGFPNTLMAAALHARYTSSFKSERIRHAKQLKFPSSDPPKEIPNLKKSYDLSRWINHHQGFEMIRHTGNNFGWDLNLSDVAQLWTEGCIIKSNLMNQLCILFKKNSSIFEMDVFQNLALNSKHQWSAILEYALTTNIPIPCLSSSWNYLLSMTQEQSNARLIQAQRDFFGAHGFKRVDQEEQSLNHGPWHDNS